MPKHPDSDAGKGAVEHPAGRPARDSGPNLSGQLGHRDQNEMLKDADSDFPEPGSNPEHSGEVHSTASGPAHPQPKYPKRDEGHPRPDGSPGKKK